MEKKRIIEKENRFRKGQLINAPDPKLDKIENVE